MTGQRRITVYVPADKIDRIGALQFYAEQDDRSLSEMVMYAIENYIQHRKIGEQDGARS